MFSQQGDLSVSAQQSLLTSLNLTSCNGVEPEHFLISMLDCADGPLHKVTNRFRPGTNLQSLRETLITATRGRNNFHVAAEWSAQLLTERTVTMFHHMQTDPQWQAADPPRREMLLAAAALHVATPRVQRVFSNMGIPVNDAVAWLRRPPVASQVSAFDSAGFVQRQAFRASGRAILNLLESEGKGLGMSRVGTPLLLLALIARQDSIFERALRLQAIRPKNVHESLLIHLRALSRKRFNDQFQLHRESMQPHVVTALEKAAELSADLNQPLIGEAEIAKGLLFGKDYFVESFLTSMHANVADMQHYVLQRTSDEEEERDVEQALPSLKEVEQRLRARIIGQDHVIDTVMPLIKRMRFGYSRPNRPLAVLLFLGNSGTGKTQLAKEIAHAMYGSEENLIFLEMGQFGSEESKNIFVGAPPGYTGYGEGLLTNGLRDKPEAVVLFDEVEKAHRSVFDVLLRLLDEGQIADPAGPVRDGRKCIIILTSNHALDVLQSLIDQQSTLRTLRPAERERARLGIRRAILDTKLFRPEFLNRVDDLILFNTFDAETYKHILRWQLQRESQRLQKEKNLSVEFADSLLQQLVNQCIERRDEGARVCEKLIGDLVITPLIDFFLEDGNEHVTGARVALSATGELIIEPVGREAGGDAR